MAASHKPSPLFLMYKEAFDLSVGYSPRRRCTGIYTSVPSSRTRTRPQTV